MVIATRKHGHTTALPKKPLRFNLGGLIKKKMTWKKPIDALASSVQDIQLDYGQGSEIQHSHPGETSFNGGPTAKPYSEYPNFTHEQPTRHHSNSIDISQSSLALEDQYTTCRTECISLQNSEMTAALTCDGSEKRSLQLSQGEELWGKPFKSETTPLDASLEESVCEYRNGGYHPVRIGDTYVSDVNRYKIVDKLGWGHFSTVWLCVSLTTGEFVAMKIVKSDSNYADAARDEIRILKHLQEQDEEEFDIHHIKHHNTRIVCLLDNFLIVGPNGTHLTMVFELMGENLLHLIFDIRASKLAIESPIDNLSGALLPMRMVKHLMRQILQSVHSMHQKGIIHTDIKPENILLACKDTPQNVFMLEHGKTHKFRILPSRPIKADHKSSHIDSMSVKIADLGNATFSNLHFTNNIQTRQYRAPEILLKYKSWGASADIWSIGCLAFELLTGDYLFEPKDGDSFSKNEDHLAQIVELIGEFPSNRYLSECKLYSAFFKDSQAMRNISSLKFWPLRNVLVEKYKFDPEDDDVNLFCDFISKCLRYNMNERYDCGSLLGHPLFRANALYDEKECKELPNHNHKIIGFTCQE